MFVALSVLLALACLGPAGAKLAGAPALRESAAHFGIPWNRYRLARDSITTIARALAAFVITAAYLAVALTR